MTVARALVFFTSAVVLVLEILAGRLLAPYIGVTLETFTAIIGTVLAGIALGSWVGGRAADRLDPEKMLGPLLMSGGVLSMLAPTVVAVVGPSLERGGPLEIVILTGLAFFAPALVLSAVSPVVVKLQLTSLDETGTVVGRLSAVGTAGALVGTFVTGFLLIATLPSRPIVLVVGVALILVGAWFAVRARSLAPKALAIWIVLAAATGSLTVAVPGPCEIESAYVCAQILIDPARPTGRILYLDTVRHSYVDVSDPTHLGFRYAGLVADVVLSQTDGPLDALYIGGGGFSLPQWLTAVRPGSTNTVLELDPVMLEIAEQSLGLTSDEYDSVLIGDARLTVRETTPGRFSLVVGDAFSGSTVPWHLTTVEFYRDVKDRMAPDGIYVMNLIDYQPASFAKAEVATLGEVFETVIVLAPLDYVTGAGGGNYVVVGTDRALDFDAIEQSIHGRQAESIVLSSDGLQAWVGDAPILRDAFAPVDQMISR